MTGKRLWQTIMLNLHRGSVSRGRYMKKVFAECGDNVRFQIRVIPLYPELIRLGSNINISTGVRFVTHDAIHMVYNTLHAGEKNIPEMAQCIEIGNNVFIGVNCTILGNVKIGDNIIVSANSLVNKDLPSGGIYGGVPAKKIGDFDSFWDKRVQLAYPTVRVNQHPTQEEIEEAWKCFEQSRRNNK